MNADWEYWNARTVVIDPTEKREETRRHYSNRIPIPGNERHKKCQNGTKCDGPGCRITTGKTKRDRENRRHN